MTETVEAKHTAGPWVAHWDEYIIPAAHERRSIGYSVDPDRTRNHYAQIVARVMPDEFGRGDQGANALLIAAAPDLAAALLAAPSPLDYKSEDGFAFDAYFAAYCTWLEAKSAALAKARVWWPTQTEAA